MTENTSTRWRWRRGSYRTAAHAVDGRRALCGQHLGYGTLEDGTRARHCGRCERILEGDALTTWRESPNLPGPR